MVTSLVFIEQIDEIDLLENIINTDTVVISTLPSVSAELSRRSISYKTTLPFFDVTGHRQTLNKSVQIVEGIRPLLNEIKTSEIQHAFEKTWVFFFRFHLNYLLSMLYVIHKAIEEYDPAELIVIRINPREILLLSRIVEQYGLSNDIKIRYIEKSDKTKAQSKIFSQIKNLTKRFIFEFQLCIFPLFRWARSPVLALEDSYNMPHLLREVCRHHKESLPVYLSINRSSLKVRLIEILKGETFSFFSIPSNTKFNISVNFHDQLNFTTLQIHKWLNKNPDTSTIFGVNMSMYLVDYIENKLSHKMLLLHSEIFHLKRILDVVQPKKVLAQHSLGLGYALGEICSQRNIAALLISHGSHVPHNHTLAELEWAVHAHTIFNSHYPFVAIQTPWAKKFLNGQDGVISKSIETGPLLLTHKHKSGTKQELRKKLFGGYHPRRIILHAGTLKGWHTFRPWVYETFDEYISNINDLIRAVEAVPNLFLAIRFRPQPGISLEDLKLSLIKSNKYTIYIDGEFIDYLLASDLLISYSSTTIEEALQNRIPVLQYAPDGKYEHIPAQELSMNKKNNISAIYSVMSENNLIPALLWWSKNHTENKNNTIIWSEHTFDIDNKMEWLSHMESKNC